MTELDPDGIPRKMVVAHRALADHDLPHAFGGALALAWCTQQARGTIDLDVNVFTPPAAAERTLAALPDQIDHTSADRELLERDGQARLWWGSTPVDVFLSTTAYHAEVATRVRWEPFAGTSLPFLACDDLAVFKAFFDRTKDWADLEAMHAAGTLDVNTVIATLTRFLQVDDERITRLRSLG